MSHFVYCGKCGAPHFICGWCGELREKAHLGEWRDGQPVCGECLYAEANSQPMIPEDIPEDTPDYELEEWMLEQEVKKLDWEGGR